MPCSSIGDHVPEVTSPPPATAIPARGTARLAHEERDELARRAGLLDSPELLAPVNSLSSAHAQPRPAEIGSVSA